MSIYKTHLKYYVYAYLRTDGTPYYIGKGCGKRAWSKNHRIGVPKNISYIIIMESNLSEIGALALERFYIKWYGKKDDGTGILRNLSDGGDVPPSQKGVKRSDETRLKIKLVQTGRKQTEEHISNMVKATTKKFMAISPDGLIFTGQNLALFCRENNLEQTSMRRVAYGQLKQTQGGWTCQYI